MGKAEHDKNAFNDGGMIPVPEEGIKAKLGECEYVIPPGLVDKNSGAPHPDMDPPPPEPTLSELAAHKLPGSGIVVPPPKAKRQEPVVIDGVFHGMRDVEE